MANGSDTTSTGGTQPWTSQAGPPSHSLSDSREAHSSGSITTKIIWKADDNGDGLWDFPPRPDALYVRQTSHAFARGSITYNYQSHTSIPPDTVTANNGLDGDAVLNQSGTDKYATDEATVLTKVYVGGDSDRTVDWSATLPTLSVDAHGTLPAPAPNTTTGTVDVRIGYFVLIVSVRATQPDPSGDPEYGLNEYTMPGGGRPFSIWCQSSISSEDPDVVNFIRLRSSWTLSRHPTAMLPEYETGSFGEPGYSVVFPRFESDWPYDYNPQEGLGFSLLNGLPGSNSSFGKAQVQHLLDGGTLATSNIEIFYDAGASNHPPGGPPGYQSMPGTNYPVPNHSIPDPSTPNWLYYYNQAYPFWLPIEYVNTGAWAGLFQNSTPDHIHVGNGAHGTFNGPLIETRGGNIQWTGFAQTYGIDTYVRTITHEAEHKQMYDLLSQTGNDHDHDGVDDSYEVGIGLDPQRTDTLGVGAYLAGHTSPGSYTSASGDGEAVARLAELGRTGPRISDWADDGLNHGTVPGPNPANRIKKWDRDGNPM